MRRQRQKRVVDCQKKSFGKSLEVHRGVAFFLPVSKLPFLSKAEQGSSVRRLLLLLLLWSEAGGLTAHAFSSKATPRHDCTYRCTKGDIIVYEIKLWDLIPNCWLPESSNVDCIVLLVIEDFEILIINMYDITLFPFGKWWMKRIVRFGLFLHKATRLSFAVKGDPLCIYKRPHPWQCQKFLPCRHCTYWWKF